MTFSTAITLRNQAQYYLRLALDSDDRPVREKHLNAAREVLAEMETEIERSRIDNLEGIDVAFPETALASGVDGQIETEDESESEDGNEDAENESDGNGESDGLEEPIEIEGDQYWEDEDDEESEEEEWDINNGEDSSQPPSMKEPCLTHYLANGPGTNKPEQPAPRAVQVSNLDVRVYARMMELFEIESRHRMSICNTEYALHQARDEFAQLELSKQVSDSTQAAAHLRNI